MCLVMIQKDFNVALKKGELGEAIIREYLESKGWVVYCPVTKDRAHCFDQLASKDKEQLIMLDIKTKGRLNKWNATGINIKSYREYIKFSEKLAVPFYLVFIDDKSGDVFCQEIRKLKNEIYPAEGIIAWPLKEMKYLFNIGQEKIELLSQYDQRNYKYKPV